MEQNDKELYECKYAPATGLTAPEIKPVVIRNEVWIKVSDRPPPKNEPFFAYSYGEIIKMEWKERVDRKGWYGFDCPCACCSGHCTADFDFWMPLIKGPKDE